MNLNKILSVTINSITVSLPFFKMKVPSAVLLLNRNALIVDLVVLVLWDPNQKQQECPTHKTKLII